jgi:hypothetical protein
MNMQMIEEIRLKCDGASGQLQSSKLTTRHFEKNAYSWMNVHLATEFLSQSTTEMIHNAISDDTIDLSLCNKGIYNQIADFCKCWNVVADICNGRDGPHSPDNAEHQQPCLLEMLAWFSRWRKLNDKQVKMNCLTEYNYFAIETWLCIQSLLLAHVT